MIKHPAYAVEPWCVRETGPNLDVMAQSESMFALSTEASPSPPRVDKNTTVVFPAPLMSTTAEVGAFLAREAAAAGEPTDSRLVPAPELQPPSTVPANGQPDLTKRQASRPAIRATGRPRGT